MAVKINDLIATAATINSRIPLSKCSHPTRRPYSESPRTIKRLNFRLSRENQDPSSRLSSRLCK